MLLLPWQPPLSLDKTKGTWQLPDLPSVVLCSYPILLCPRLEKQRPRVGQD